MFQKVKRNKYIMELQLNILTKQKNIVLQVSAFIQKAAG